MRRKQLQAQTLANDSPWKGQGGDMLGFDPFTDGTWNSFLLP
jgi:hypothetical protein